MTDCRTIAVLGLGNLGRAVAQRLSRRHDVLTWTRADGTEPALVVRRAEVVVSALYDGVACRDVLTRCRGELSGRAVVNLASVAPDEAVEFEELVRGAGGRYLHSPALGSVPAALAGSLTLLVGAADFTSVAGVLEALGEPVPCGDPASAARAKLVANGVLADGLLAVGAALARGAAAGLDADLVLDVLEHTALGPMVRAKRSWLAGGQAAAHFEVRALEKDVRLLAGMAPAATATRAAIEAAGAGAEDDIAMVSVRAGRRPRALDPAARLTNAATEDDPALLAPLIAYARGHATGDPAHFRTAFRPSAHVEGVRDGAFVSWDLDTYCSNFDGRPAADESGRSRTITELRAVGTVAHATMVLQHGRDVFTDMFVLIREGAEWRIANKVYDRATTAT